MAEFIMHRNKIVRCLSGHCVDFKKGVPTHVPPAAVRDVLAAGAVATDESFNVPDDEDTTVTDLGENLAPEARKDKIINAFKVLESRNERGDFDAAGKPHPKMVSKIVGFTVDSRERNALWAELQEEKV